MDIGAARCFDHKIRIEFTKATDVFSNAAIEEFDVLRQIANLAAEFVAFLVADVDAIK